MGVFQVQSHQCLSCQDPRVFGSVMGLAGPVSVYCDWGLIFKFHLPGSTYKLFEQIRPRYTLACCWGVKKIRSRDTLVCCWDVKQIRPRDTLACYWDVKQIRPRDTLACYWDVKQPTHNNRNNACSQTTNTHLTVPMCMHYLCTMRKRNQTSLN